MRGDPMMIVLPDVQPVAEVAAADNQFRADALRGRTGNARPLDEHRPHRSRRARRRPDQRVRRRSRCVRSRRRVHVLVRGAGEYRYYCSLHGSKSGAGMAGTVTVTDG
ncbi:MAG: hypothetical protein WKF58_16555 [Ilumatobacteraceae bacterium]